MGELAAELTEREVRDDVGIVPYGGGGVKFKLKKATPVRNYLVYSA